jgi:hypothetical protein
MSLPVPIPKTPIHIRLGVMSDIPFMDELQKKYGKALGYFPRKQFEEYIKMGAVLIAEDNSKPDAPGAKERVGYVISRDRYLKRDELGVIFQLCVSPGTQRGFVGASLLRAVFHRSAYGCRLYCCWCAQDLDANYFWEAMGFVPLAFRVGSDRKRRLHIFWQKKIVAGDTETKWWYPFQTAGGALRADRVVLPIPEGVHWSEVRPVEVPAKRRSELGVRSSQESRALPAPKPERRKPSAGPGPGKVGILVGGRIKYVDRPGYVAPVPAVSPEPEKPPEPPKPKRPRKPKAEVDPKFLRGARELRDRFLEHVNGPDGAGMLLEAQ